MSSSRATASIMAINQPEVCTEWIGIVYGPSGEYVST